jgi:hypothetical protein
MRCGAKQGHGRAPTSELGLSREDKPSLEQAPQRSQPGLGNNRMEAKLHGSQKLIRWSRSTASRGKAGAWQACDRLARFSPCPTTHCVGSISLFVRPMELDLHFITFENWLSALVGRHSIIFTDLVMLGRFRGIFSSPDEFCPCGAPRGDSAFASAGARACSTERRQSPRDTRTWSQKHRGTGAGRLRRRVCLRLCLRSGRRVSVAAHSVIAACHWGGLPAVSPLAGMGRKMVSDFPHQKAASRGRRLL